MSRQDLSVAVRATSEVEVKAGRLREDLYYRISGVCLRLPPLRQRKEDILRLVEHFSSKYGEEFRRPVPKLSSEMARLFQDYSWPGNVRELEERRPGAGCAWR